jgi:hypothetical protein
MTAIRREAGKERKGPVKGLEGPERCSKRLLGIRPIGECPIGYMMCSTAACNGYVVIEAMLSATDRL